MSERVLEAARRVGGLEQGRPVVVMLSGGRDSVCLLDIAVRLVGVDGVVALHVNYGLRQEAGEDELFCRRLCRRIGVEIVVSSVDAKPTGNVQAWAREIRYCAATHLAVQRGAVILAGHTATDQAETILYRLAASPGRRALLGMTPHEGRVWRPLIEMSRDDTAAYCRDRGLQWREDTSNASPAYARNRIRHGLAAALREIHPAAEANLIKTAQLLREEAEVLDTLVEQTLAGHDYIEVERLRALPRALQRLVSRRLAEDAVGGLVPAAASRIGDILDLAKKPRGGRLDLEGGARAVIARGRLSFEESPPRP